MLRSLVGSELCIRARLCNSLSYIHSLSLFVCVCKTRTHVSQAVYEDPCSPASHCTSPAPTADCQHAESKCMRHLPYEGVI